MEAYSDFIYQSIAIHWYFNEGKHGGDYSDFGENFCPSLGLSFRHFGTICFGSIMAYYPESLNSMLVVCEQKN